MDREILPMEETIQRRETISPKLPEVLTPKKSDISVTSDSGPCPSPTEHEYRPKYFDEPDCLDSNKENMPPIESITPPSLKNLSLEEENHNNDEYKATSWEANVAQNLDLLPRSSSPYPKKKTRTLEDLETDMDNNMVNITNFFDRPQNEKSSPRPKPFDNNSENCPTPQNSPHTWQNCQYHLLSPIKMRFGGSSQTKEEYPMVGQLVSEGSHPGYHSETMTSTL